MSYSMFTVRASYPAKIDHDLDNRIEGAAGESAHFGGCGIDESEYLKNSVLSTTGRSLCWWKEDLFDANVTAKRIRRANLPNVRVTVHDEERSDV